MFNFIANLNAIFTCIILIKYLSNIKIKFSLKEILYLISLSLMRSFLFSNFNRAIELSMYYTIFIIFLYKFYICNSNNIEYKYLDIDQNINKKTYINSNYDILTNFFVVYIFGLLIDGFFAFIFFKSKSFIIIINNATNYLLNALIISLLMFFAAFVYKTLKSKYIHSGYYLNFLEINNNKTLVFYLIFLSSNISLLLYQLLIVERNPELYFKFLFIYVAYAIFMGSIIVLMIRNVKLERDAKNQMKLYSDIIENSVEEIRSYKHDQKNILLTLKGFIDNINDENLKNYFYNQIYNDIPSVNNEEFLELSKINSLPLKGLLISKLTRAKNYNVNVDIMVSGTINNLFIKDVDFCRIFGILFDNAIEEAQQTKDKKISLGFVIDKNSLYYIISNSLSSIPDCNKIYQKNVSSKGAHRGLGLSNVMKILSKNKGCTINTFVDNNIFHQEIECKKIQKGENRWVNNIKNKILYNTLDKNKIS